MKRLSARYVAYAALLTIMGCNSDRVVEINREVMGLDVEIKAFPGMTSRSTCSKLAAEALELFELRLNSIWGEHGELDKLNKQRNVQDASDDFLQLITQAQNYRSLTEGAYDPQLGRVKGVHAFFQKMNSAPRSDTMSSKMHYAPNPDTLLVLLDAAQNTSVQIEAGGAVRILGKGMLNLGRLPIGWAVDAAADAMIAGGVESGRISVNSISRFWGEKIEALKTNLPSLAGDTTRYIANPEEGAFCIIDPRNFKPPMDENFYPWVIDPANGMPSDAAVSVACWAPTASEAAVYAEAMFVMGRIPAIEWLQGMHPVGVFYVYRSQNEYLAETNPRITDWVSVSLP